MHLTQSHYASFFSHWRPSLCALKKCEGTPEPNMVILPKSSYCRLSILFTFTLPLTPFSMETLLGVPCPRQTWCFSLQATLLPTRGAAAGGQGALRTWGTGIRLGMGGSEALLEAHRLGHFGPGSMNMGVYLSTPHATNFRKNPCKTLLNYERISILDGYF